MGADYRRRTAGGQARGRSFGPRHLALVAVLLVLVAVAVVNVVPSPDRYEISLYDAYPTYFWALVVGATFTGALTVIWSAGIPGDRSWIYGLAVMLLSNALLVTMPLVRGYEMFGRSDALTHIGFTRDIAASGGIESNIYPPTHLLLMALSEATGVDLMGIAVVVPVVFSGIYFGAMGYLLVFLFDERERVLFGLPFAMLPVLRMGHVGVRPYDLSLMLVPLVLYTFVRGQRHPSPPIRVTFLVALVALLLYHPLTALFVIGIFSTHVAGRYLLRPLATPTAPTNLLSLSVVAFAGWYHRFSGIVVRFEGISEVLLGTEEGQPPAESYQQTAEEASPALIDVLRVLTFRFGVEGVLFGLGFAFLGLWLLLVFLDRTSVDLYTVTFGSAFVLFSVGGLVFLFADLIVGPNRPFQIAKIGAIVLSGQLFYLLWRRVDWNPARPEVRAGVRSSLVIGLLVVILLSTFSVYDSPLASEKNHQVTEMEVEGVEWLTQHRDEETTELTEFGMSYRRFYEARYGTDGPKPFLASTPPPNFNYTVYRYVGQSYTNDTYLTLTRYGRVVYPSVFPKYPSKWRYTPRDFARLDRDHTTARIYDNGDYNQYLIDAIGGVSASS